VINLEYIKYPRTFHLPWSLGKTNDDKVLSNTDHFKGKRVIVTEKLDGENTSLYPTFLHARSIDSKDHPSRHWLKAFHSSLNIPEYFRICGENLFAAHSINYDNLESYFYAFSAWTDLNYCVDWDTTVELLSTIIGIKTVPILYDGIWDVDKIKSCWTGVSKCGGQQEGYVVRMADRFNYNNFDKNVAKFVRENHVQTDKHWLSKPLIKNKLKTN